MEKRQSSAYLVFLMVAASCLWSCQPELPPGVADAYARLPEQIDFNFHVKPILSDKCFACHGPDAAKREAKLRLDLPEAAYAALESDNRTHAIVPHRPAKSQLYHRVTSSDPELVMPPPDSKLSLSEKEVATLTKWIEQGAVYRPHWSFIAPRQDQPPKVKQLEWPENEIDHFVLSRLGKEGLQPTPKADKRTLIRRLSFDLTGLPPTLGEVKDFLEDKSPDAYAKLVDRLLASPAYGERMAMDWMDVARYADSDGYLDDKHRDFTPWRNWVIRAFNDNMPYDRFVTWQLAGDLLPDATLESTMATAFNRLHRKNSEAGIVFEEYRVEYVADRTNTFGKAFLGLTMECARCHDHKYDPVSQEDYYQTFAFFNSTHEVGTAVYGPGQTPGPALLLASEQQEEILSFLKKAVKEQETELADLQQDTPEGWETWRNDVPGISQELDKRLQQGLVAHLPFDQFRPVDDKNVETHARLPVNQPIRVKEPVIGPGEKGQALFFDTYTSLRLPDPIGWFDRTDPFSISLSLFPDTVYQEAGVLFHCEDLRLGYKGYSLHLEDNYLKFIVAHSYPQNAIQVRSTQPLPVKEWTNITLTYDGSSSAGGIRLYWNGQQQPLQIDHDNLYKGILFVPDIHTYGFAGFELGERDKVKIMRRGGVDELKIYNRSLTALEVLYQGQPEKARDYLANTAKDQPGKLLEYYHRFHHSPAIELRKKLQRSRQTLNDTITPIPEIMVMGDLPEPRPTYVLERGLYSAPGREVQPGIPEKILPLPENFPANRLGLSRWLFAPDHPLTARVFVNRIWQMHFGRGIVATADDFGSQGELPTHPAMLDWLAVFFRESGWDIKALHRKIVLSATYQQGSGSSPQLAERDPDNVLLARGPSFRLPAEMIRDNALAVSGLLVRKPGGPSAYPYQPDGLWDEISNKSWRYPYLQQPGEGLYRRSLYTIFKRTSPPPAMLVFDMPDRSACSVRRINTSTPLQALVLMNDEQFLEAARVLAEKLLTETGEDIDGSLNRAYQLLTGRSPGDREMKILTRFFQEELKRFSEEPQNMMQYLSIGERPPSGEVDLKTTAALATVVHSIMNTADAYTRR